jgi:alanyl-tRNA synthetase
MYREVMEQCGTTEFLGYEQDSCEAKILAIVPDDDGTFDLFLDRTPFYAESGGQVGDTGAITSGSNHYEVIDTTFALPGLRRHHCRVVSGSLTINQTVTANIDSLRRLAIRRHHTATHILHWSLRQVLGEHVKQAGSLVDDERLRFDFSHYDAVTEEELLRIEELANSLTLSNEVVDSSESSKDEALAKGAIAFFGDKYGDRVRVLSAGPSVELCGGTHVSATGDIGIIKVISEGSVGANLRRIEAVAGTRTLSLLQHDRRVISDVARLVGAGPDELMSGVQRKVDDIKGLQDENKILRSRLATGAASTLAAHAVDGAVIAQVDDLSPSDLRDLTIAVRQQPGVHTVVLIGVSPGGGVSLVGAVDASTGKNAAQLIAAAAKAVGGGGGGKGDIATAGGKNSAGIPEALRLAQEAAHN